MGKLNGKVAIVTGASSGIGEATALSLASEGANIVLVARREERLKALEKRIGETAKTEAVSVVGDVSQVDLAERSVKCATDKWGGVDILVNNAGVMYLGGVADAKVEDWKRMMDINVLGLMYFTRFAVPSMKVRGGGNIVNISSVSGRVVSSRSAGYSATKFAVNAFSDGLRQEVAADKIRVTIIEPGAVLTELTDHITDPNVKDSVKGWVASMNALTSEDIANAIVYAVTQPPHVNVNEILIRPTDQTF